MNFPTQNGDLQDERPIKDIDEEEAELKTALQDIKAEQPVEADQASTSTSQAGVLPSLTEEAGSQDEALFPKSSEMSWTEEGVTTADLASKKIESPEQQQQQDRDKDTPVLLFPGGPHTFAWDVVLFTSHRSFESQHRFGNYVLVILVSWDALMWFPLKRGRGSDTESSKEHC